MLRGALNWSLQLLIYSYPNERGDGVDDVLIPTWRTQGPGRVVLQGSAICFDGDESPVAVDLDISEGGVDGREATSLPADAGPYTLYVGGHEVLAEAREALAGPKSGPR